MAMVIYNFQLVRLFGHPEWAERTFGPGGSYTVWRLAGFCVIIGGLLANRYGLLASIFNL